MTTKCKPIFLFTTILTLVVGQLVAVPINGKVEASTNGASYLTDTDNWGGGAENTAADNDMDTGIKNQNNSSNLGVLYSKYPIELKIENVSNLPQKSAHLLVRALDIDEYNPEFNNPANGEWNRVYFSSDPSDISLGPNYTPFPTTATWENKIAQSGIGVDGAGYKLEIPNKSYVGTLVGEDSVWSTSVLPFDSNELSRISHGNNYVGITLHHNYLDNRPSSSLANTNWQMTVDWVQLIIDGGDRALAEFTNAAFKVEQGKIVIDTSFIPKMDGNFSLEVFITEEVEENDVSSTRSLGQEKKLFSMTGTQQQDWNNIVIADSNINPGKNYSVNLILSEDRGGGPASEKNTNPGKVQHLISLSTEHPSINTQPVSQTVIIGDNIALSVSATVNGSGTPSYQWYSNMTNSNIGGTPILGATNATYDPPTGTTGKTYYYVIVTNPNNNTTTTSNVAEVTVNPLINVELPSIHSHPASQTVTTGDSVSLSVSATVSDGGKLSYQWYSNLVNSNSGGSLIPGATSASYAPPTGVVGTMYYYAVVANTNSSVNGYQTATAISNVAEIKVSPLIHAKMPNIITQPTNQTVNVGDSASLSVSAIVNDGGTLSYQWYNNVINGNYGGSLIQGATSPSYVPPTEVVGTIYYYAAVTNTNSSVNGNQTAIATSDVAEITVSPLIHAKMPNIITQPTNQTVNIGDSALLSVSASVDDGGVLSYQWYSNSTNSLIGGTPIVGATSPTYVPPTGEVETLYYYAVVTNTNSSVTGNQTALVTSDVAKVTVIFSNPNPNPNLEPSPAPELTPEPTPNPAPDTNKPEVPEKPEQPEEQPNPLPTSIFSDISSHWAKEMIEDMASRGIINGYLDGTFRPNEPIQRQHVAVMLTRIFELSPIRTASPFKDVSPSHTYFDAIMRLQQAGIIDGMDGMFNPKDTMTRAQMAKVLVLAFGLEPNGSSTFKDVPATHWASGYIAAIADLGIALGDNRKFKPNEPMTRAQFVAFLSRALNIQHLNK